MGKYSAFGYIIFMMFVAVMTVAFFSYTNKTNLEFEQLRLMAVVNNATDSALLEAVTSDTLTIDSSNLRPKNASETFFKVFMDSYGISDTSKNRVKMYDYIPLLALVADDGIYLGYPRIVDGRRYEFGWDYKIPYTVHSTTGEWIVNLTVTGENLTMQRLGAPCTVPDPSDATLCQHGNAINFGWCFSDVQSQVWEALGKTQPDDAYRKVINDLVVGAVTEGITGANETARGWSNKFYIPANIADFNVVDIHGVTLMAFVQNVDIYTHQKIDYFTIGGTQIIDAEKVVGYVRTDLGGSNPGGRWMYAYESDYNAAYPAGTPPVVRIFDDVFEAAELGYEPDLNAMR